MIPVAPRIVNDVSYERRINHDIHFEWQAHYLVRCVCDACSIYFTGNICASCLAPVRILSGSSACAAVGCALPCCIRLPKTFVALQCMIFFSIGLLVLIGLFFFIDSKLPPPACPGTTGNYCVYIRFVGSSDRHQNTHRSISGLLRMHRQCKRRRGEASKLQHQLHLALAAAKHWRGGSMAGRWHAARHH